MADSVLASTHHFKTLDGYQFSRQQTGVQLPLATYSGHLLLIYKVELCAADDDVLLTPPPPIITVRSAVAAAGGMFVSASRRRSFRDVLYINNVHGLISSNVGWVVVDQLLFRFSICGSVSEIFVIKVESCQKSRQILDGFFALLNFRGQAI